jgi:hypothetical protein
MKKEIKEVLRESAMSLVEIMLLEKESFRIVLWNNDNWNEPLPQRILEAFPTQLVLDIKEQALEDSYIDPATGEIIICTTFDGNEYLKVLDYGELIAVLSLEGQPYILNDFPQDKEKRVVYKHQLVDELVEMVSSDGIPEEAVKKSVDCFMKNNPKLRERFK